MTFLAPWFLVGLFGLLVPIIIHLWSKNTRKSVAFGSIRFLQGTETKTMRSVAPSQWLLLFLRLAFLSVLVILMAQLGWPENQEPKDTLYLIDAEYEGEDWLLTFQDTLSGENEIRWLSSNYPNLEESPTKVTDYWIMLNEIPTSRAKRTVVISPLRQNNFVGMSKPISDKIEFYRLPVEPSKVQLISTAIGTEPFTLYANYDEWTTTIDQEQINSGEKLEVTYDFIGENEDLRKIFESAFATINELTFLRMVPSSNPKWRILLDDEQAPKEDFLIFSDSLQVSPWIQLAPHLISISSDLTAEEALEVNLPRKLLELFSEDLIDESGGLLTIDIESYQSDWTIEHGSPISEQRAGSLWLVLLGLLLLERWVSHKSEKS